MRVAGLEAQSLEPLKSREEMRRDEYAEADAVDAVVARLQAIPEYRTRFARAFGEVSAVTAANLGRAIAAFERSLVAPNAPFDRYMRGDASAMTPLQLAGLQRFQTIGCANCHSGPMFSDYKLHVLGVPDNPGLPAPDAGANASYAFRTASLRNVKFTAPYMHSGVFYTLDDVIAFYNSVRGARFGSRNPNVSQGHLDPLLFQLGGFGDRRELVAFLEALSDDGFDRTIPDSVPSGLAVGGRIRD
jgi:cytochrome c peroxidase